MVVLVVATIQDPGSINPARVLLGMPGWEPGPNMEGIKTFKNGTFLRLLEQEKTIIEEDDLDQRWENLSGEVVDEIIFLSKHTAVSSRAALTIHPIGIPHLKEGDKLPQGGKPGWAGPPSPRMGAWLVLLKKIATAHNLVPEFEITFEATHHGPVTSKPTMFIEIGSTEEHWGRDDAAHVIAQLIWEGLGLGGGCPVGEWNSKTGNKKILLGLGGGHYVPRHMDVIHKEKCWVGHFLSGYALPMEDPGQLKGKSSAAVGGTWRQAITVAYEATRAAFPGGEVLAHVDQKSFKAWQKKAITEYLGEQNIKIGKPGDFS
ncbi:hypothetical protein M9H77_09762 [Catharanthus roseus]|uniref:Uncharacterized protein n=1 Tax=Catharanthus roseus TaxID=4058 RepID=A0ACC0C1Q0_CATRO|nr:hypothetical protein M9H77_09762 [Catharanthus roseus]